MTQSTNSLNLTNQQVTSLQLTKRLADISPLKKLGKVFETINNNQFLNNFLLQEFHIMPINSLNKIVNLKELANYLSTQDSSKIYLNQYKLIKINSDKKTGKVENLSDPIISNVINHLLVLAGVRNSESTNNNESSTSSNSSAPTMSRSLQRRRTLEENNDEENQSKINNDVTPSRRIRNNQININNEKIKKVNSEPLNKNEDNKSSIQTSSLQYNLQKQQLKIRLSGSPNKHQNTNLPNTKEDTNKKNSIPKVTPKSNNYSNLPKNDNDKRTTPTEVPPLTNNFIKSNHLSRVELHKMQTKGHKSHLFGWLRPKDRK